MSPVAVRPSRGIPGGGPGQLQVQAGPVRGEGLQVDRDDRPGQDQRPGDAEPADLAVRADIGLQHDEQDDDVDEQGLAHDGHVRDAPSSRTSGLSLTFLEPAVTCGCISQRDHQFQHETARPAFVQLRVAMSRRVSPPRRRVSPPDSARESMWRLPAHL